MTDHRFDPHSDHSSLAPRPSPLSLCGRCRNYGIWLTPRGVIAECPKLQLRLNDHPPLTDAARMVTGAGRRLTGRGIAIQSQHVFNVACALTKTSKVKRLTGQDLINRFFGWGGSQKLRHLHAAIEELRAVWLLPLCSSKSMPYGYWIATDADDFLAWVEQTKSAPLKYLATVAAMAKANFRDLQLDFEFEKEPVEATLPPIAA